MWDFSAIVTSSLGHFQEKFCKCAVLPLSLCWSMELVLFQAIETDMGEQVRRCDALNECGQQIVRYVDSQVAVSRIDTLLENLQERWEKLVQMMEHYSNQVITTVTRSWA